MKSVLLLESLLGNKRLIICKVSDIYAYNPMLYVNKNNFMFLPSYKNNRQIILTLKKGLKIREA